MVPLQTSDGRISATSSFQVVVTIAIILFLAMALAPSARAQTYTILQSFTGQNGSEPFAGVTLDRAGNLYGTTYFGGNYGSNCTYGCGTVFKLTHHGSGWILMPLYGFNGGTDGSNPGARVIIGPDGSLYGTTFTGGGGGCGGGGCGTVFSLRPPSAACKSALCGWTETVLHRFMGDSDGADPGDGDLVFDQAGNLYGTTVGDINSDAGTVFKLTPSNGGWTETILYSFTHNEEPFGGVIFDNAGNLYGTTSRGGIGYGSVYELTPSGSGWVEHTLYAFRGGSDGGNLYAGVTFDPSGNLYGATLSGVVYELQPSNGSWTFVLLYSFHPIEGSYNAPTLDAAGNLYGTLSQAGPNRGGIVFKLTHSEGEWTETDLFDFGANNFLGSQPIGGVVLDAKGNLYGTTFRGGNFGSSCPNGCGVVFEIAP